MPDGHKLSVAPMLDWTDRHARFFLRLLSKKTVLYSEMVVAQAVRHGDRDRLLGLDPSESPVVLQLGGSDPGLMAEAAAVGASYGYTEININAGCPSDRVQSGRFGACLMAEPATVAACLRAMQAACPLPVTVKTRIGIDEQDSYGFLCRFIETVAEAGCGHFILHARKAWLNGLSPRENREVPPLHYDTVYRIKSDYPHLAITINGGIKTVAEAQEHLAYVDGVMIGRAVMDNIWFLTTLARDILGEQPPVDRLEAVQVYRQYMVRQLADGVPLRILLRPLIGLMQGQPGARNWRRMLTTADMAAGIDVLDRAVDGLNVCYG